MNLKKKLKPNASSKPITAPTWQEVEAVLSRAEKGDVVYLDLDNCAFVAELSGYGGTTFDSESAYAYAETNRMPKGETNEEKVLRELTNPYQFFNIVKPLTIYKITDTKIVDTLKSLKEKGVYVVANTSRGFDSLETTRTNLDQAGLDFIELSEDNFVGRGNKRLMAEAYEKKYDLEPQKRFFVDDKKKYTEQFLTPPKVKEGQEAIEYDNISTTSIHYTKYTPKTEKGQDFSSYETAIYSALVDAYPELKNISETMDITPQSLHAIGIDFEVLKNHVSNALKDYPEKIPTEPHNPERSRILYAMATLLANN